MKLNFKSLTKGKLSNKLNNLRISVGNYNIPKKTNQVGK